MSNAEQSIRTNRAKRWMITIGIFVIVQLIFMFIDGTTLVPNINDSGNLLPRIGRWILDSRLFTEWIASYSFPFFNMCMAIHVLVILILAVLDIRSMIFSKK